MTIGLSCWSDDESLVMLAPENDEGKCIITVPLHYREILQEK
ncbi:MAG: hypothetical protein AB2L14_06535 [Candidatus Xenobiia bacterium LiM19]